jgi:peptidoglycan hydrolase-like protein with peptidoglycan-binding domain
MKKILVIIFFAVALTQQTFAISKYYYGVYTGPESGISNGVAGVEQIPLATFITDAGKSPSMVGHVQWWQPDAPWGDFDSARKAWSEDIRNKGMIPVVMWGPYDPSSGDFKKMSLAKIAKGDYDTYIKTWAKQVKAWGKPIILRPMHELNVKAQLPDVAIPWSAYLDDEKGVAINRPVDAINAWRKIVDIFKAEGVTNVTWMWSVLSWPSAAYGGSNSVSMASVYPGDAYVDWIGIECHNFDTSKWVECNSADILNTYKEAAALSPTKPLFMAEMSSREDSTDPNRKANWISNALDYNKSTSVFKTMPRVMGMMWWNDKPRAGNPDISIESSELSKTAFRNVVSNNVYETNTFNYIDRSPIVAAGVNDSQFLSLTAPDTITVNSSTSSSIIFKNTGSTVWSNTGSYKLGSYDPYDNLNWSINRINLEPSETIRPGQSKTFTFSLKAPSSIGEIGFNWKMVMEYIEWFGQATLSKKILVKNVTTPVATSIVVNSVGSKGGTGVINNNVQFSIYGSGFTGFKRIEMTNVNTGGLLTMGNIEQNYNGSVSDTMISLDFRYQSFLERKDIENYTLKVIKTDSFGVESASNVVNVSVVDTKSSTPTCPAGTFTTESCTCPNGQSPIAVASGTKIQMYTCDTVNAMCTAVYKPVCGTPKFTCVDKSQSCIQPISETYSNRCELDKAGAIYISEGVCGSSTSNTFKVSLSSSQPSQINLKDASNYLMSFNAGGNPVDSISKMSFTIPTNLNIDPNSTYLEVRDPSGAYQFVGYGYSEYAKLDGTNYRFDFIKGFKGGIGSTDSNPQEVKVYLIGKINGVKGSSISDKFNIKMTSYTLQNAGTISYPNLVNYLSVADGTSAMCTAVYKPVCGQITPACLSTGCKTMTPAPKTYSNICEMKKAGATYLYDGVCGTVAITPPTIPTIPTSPTTPVGDVADTSDNNQQCLDLTYNMKLRSRDATTNNEVSDLQDFLNTKGYLASEPTGYFGQGTLVAVKKFQAESGLTPSGTVSAYTRAKIKSITCNTAPLVAPSPVATTNSTVSTTRVFGEIATRRIDAFDVTPIGIQSPGDNFTMNFRALNYNFMGTYSIYAWYKDSTKGYCLLSTFTPTVNTKYAVSRNANDICKNNSQAIGALSYIDYISIEKTK